MGGWVGLKQVAVEEYGLKPYGLDFLFYIVDENFVYICHST